MRDRLQNFIDSSNLYLVPYEPTHNLKNSSTWIDHCIVDSPDALVSSGQQDVSFLSAHDLIYVVLDVGIGEESSNITHRNFKNFCKDSFLDDLRRADWSPFFCSNNIDSKVEYMNFVVTACLDRHAPYVTASTKDNKKPAPWLTAEIRALMNERNMARRVWRRKRCSILHDRFKDLRNLVKTKIDTARNEYYTTTLGNLNSRSEAWTTLRRLGLIKSKFSSHSLHLSISQLNRHFVSSGSTQVDVGHQLTPAPPSRSTGELFDDDKFHFSNVLTETVLKAIFHSKSNATGLDGISIDEVRKGLPVLLPIIEHLFHFSLSHGVFPSQWKKSVVLPLPKIKSPIVCNDYRPISILCALSKCLEKLAADQISNYLEQRNLFDPYQSAYRRGHSTHTALIRVVDYCRHAIDKRKVVIMVSFDFSKAFDKVNHSILLMKLRRLNFSSHALKFLHSYLTERRQAVKGVNGELSEWANTTRGVPQGSVLGPLLFIIYVSDLCKTLHECSYNFYADDLQLMIECEPANILRGIEKVNRDVEAVCGWAEDNELQLNGGKTKVILIGSTKYTHSFNLKTLPQIKVQGIGVEYSTDLRILGVTLTNDLSWRKHINNATRRIYGTVCQLRRCRKLLPLQIRTQLVSTLVFPLIDYCCIIHLDLTDELTLLQQRALNSYIRFIYNVRKDEHITPYFNMLGWLKVDSRKMYTLGCMMYNVLKTDTLVYLRDKFRNKNQAGIRNTRLPSQNLIIKPCRTQYYKKSFTFEGADLWNRLPVDIRNSESLMTFKIKLHNFLRTSQAQRNN